MADVSALDAVRKALGETERRLGVSKLAQTPVIEPAPKTGASEFMTLGALFPEGRLAPGSVTSIIGSTALTFAAAALSAGADGWTAMVAMPAASPLAAAEAGLDLSRVVWIPDAGLQAASVVGALVDGFGCVIVGPNIALAPSDRRRLVHRVRERDAALVSTAAWDGARLSLVVSGRSWRRVGDDYGRIVNQELTVERTGRGSGGARRSFVVDLPAVPGDFCVREVGVERRLRSVG